MQQPLPQQRWIKEHCNYLAGNQLVIKKKEENCSERQLGCDNLSF